ncbi:MAG: ferrous iron transport protein A [Candidatus Izemoplasmatales bacterium]
MTLQDIRPGESCVITSLHTNNLRKRIIDMGLVTGTKVFVKKMAPLGDPIEIVVRGYALTIRKAEARTIHVDRADTL